MATSLTEAESWLYHLGDVDTNRAAEIGASDTDLVVIEQSEYSTGEARNYTSEELTTMRGENDKTIVSYISIGEAETYRDYWDTDWETTAPDWLAEVNPNWDDNIKVEYWNEDWQEIVFSMVDQMIDQGFNGLYLDIIDAYEYFEETDPDAGIDYRAEMVEFVAAIRAHAEETLATVDPDREFVIIGQNGAELIEEDGYLEAVDGIGQEDMRFYYDDPENESEFALQTDDDYTYTLDLLKAAEAAGVEVFAVEYMTAARQEEYSEELAAQAQELADAGIPLYLGEDRDLTEIYDQSAIEDFIDDTTETELTVDQFAVQYSNADYDEVADSPYDLMIVEGKPGETDTADLTDAQVQSLVAEGRVIAGYVSVGQTDDSRPYWDASWTDDGTDTGTPTDDAPSWLAEQADSFDAAIVEFWDEDWQSLVIDQVVDMAERGYNGIFLDNMLSYYEIASVRDELGTEQAEFYAQEMMAFVIDIAEAAQAINPDFVVIPNGGPYIVGDAGYASDSDAAVAYYEAIDAIMAESFFGLVNGVYDDTALDAFETTFADQEIDVLALEYSTDADAIAAFAAEAEERGFAASVSEDQALDSLPESLETTDNTEDDPVIETGSKGADELYGGTGDDELSGSAGADTLAGDAGDDTLKGGKGADEIFGEAGDDMIYGGRGGDYLEGGDGNDLIIGGLAQDYLGGGAGDDTLYGGRSSDTLLGGDGADTFIFNANSGYDTVEDFDVSMDIIQHKGGTDYEVVETTSGVALEFADGTGIEFAGLTIDQVDDITFA